MNAQQPTMSPLDIIVLLKIISLGDKPWTQLTLAEELFMSQSEISKSIARSRYASLIDPSGKKVRKLSLYEFLKFGISYAFPQQPGAVVRGIPTAHSALPLNQIIQSNEQYVWASGKGNVRGQKIVPLYPSVIYAVQLDSRLHELLALVDALRVGKAREKEIASIELKKRILDEE
jgi:hypothetical protein